VSGWRGVKVYMPQSSEVQKLDVYPVKIVITRREISWWWLQQAQCRTRLFVENDLLGPWWFTTGRSRTSIASSVNR
jgi:hypothetical protein